MNATKAGDTAIEYSNRMGHTTVKVLRVKKKSHDEWEVQVDVGALREQLGTIKMDDFGEVLEADFGSRGGKSK